MIAFAPWQALLDGLGWLVAQIYELIPSYGVTIIVLTVLIRLVLLPLGIRQIRSMQHMQIIQPKVKQIQQKYKQNRQRQQEEIMKLYKEYGVNPFSGCWPMLLQFPILIAMYSVLRFPQHPIHLPEDTRLYRVVTEQMPLADADGDGTVSQTELEELQARIADLPGQTSGSDFLGMNLLCSATQAGNESAKLGDQVPVGGEAVAVQYPVDCGDDVARAPYYLFAVLMFATTYYQQRQMQKASPPGAASQQQQALLKVMPLMFGVFGIFFPAGLVLYWTTSNGWQIGQQYFMLKTRPTAETLAAAANDKRKPEKKGFLASMMDRAEQQRERREGTARRPSGGRKSGGNGKPGASRGPDSRPKKPGGKGGGDPKKRPKR